MENIIKKINEEIFNEIVKYLGGDIIRVSYIIADIYLQKLIDNGYEILGYDGIIIDNKGTLSPVSLVFDFCRSECSYRDRNEKALESITELYQTAIQEGYDCRNLYVEIVFKRITCSSSMGK